MSRPITDEELHYLRAARAMPPVPAEVVDPPKILTPYVMSLPLGTKSQFSLNVKDAPVDPDSDKIAAVSGHSGMFNMGYWGDEWAGDPSRGTGIVGLPINNLDFSQIEPVVVVVTEADGYPSMDDGQGRAIWHIPSEFKHKLRVIQGGRDPSTPRDGDSHLILMDQAQMRLEELFYVWFNPADNQWHAACGQVTDLRTPRLTGPGKTTASGIPFSVGLIYYDELVSKAEFDHGFFFWAAEWAMDPNLVFPATHTDGWSSNPFAPPMGARFRLRPDFDMTGYPPLIQKIFRACQTYGTIGGDTMVDKATIAAGGYREKNGDYALGGAYDPRFNQFNAVDSPDSWIRICRERGPFSVDWQLVDRAWSAAASKALESA